MSYDCIDAYGDLTSALRLNTPAEWDDERQHVSEETDLALAEISRLQKAAAALPAVLAALQNYQRLVAYLQRTTNPEEWATHGDWKRLQREADAAIAKASP